MWYSPSKIAQMEEREDDDRKQQDDSGLATTNNDDSGFLSVGNMQFSGEIRDMGSQSRQTRDPQDGGQQRVAPMMPEATTSLMATKESIRTSDSGVVDVELSDDLDRLTLSGRLIQSEPKSLELSHVDAGVADGEQHRGDVDDDDQCLMLNKDLWQFYSKDDDGDTWVNVLLRYLLINIMNLLCR